MSEGAPPRSDATTGQESLRARVLHTRFPESRLPDPRDALDYERGRSVPRLVDEGLEGAELLLPTDDSMAIHLVTMWQ